MHCRRLACRCFLWDFHDHDSSSPDHTEPRIKREAHLTHPISNAGAAAREERQGEEEDDKQTTRSADQDEDWEGREIRVGDAERGDDGGADLQRDGVAKIEDLPRRRGQGEQIRQEGRQRLGVTAGVRLESVPVC